MDIPVTELEQAVGGNLRELIAEQVGPLGDRAEEKRQDDARKAELWRWLAAHPVVKAQPALAQWTNGVKRSGIFGGSVDATRAELEKVLAVLHALPATGAPLPVFADTVLGDPHALDDDTRRARLVLKALTVIFDLPPPQDATDRRELWQRAGVSDDELSSTVLVAGFRLNGGNLTESILRSCAETGEGVALTLRQLRRNPLRAGLPISVWVFENPSVLALALERFGRSCPPLVCTSGWPSSAGILLLQQLNDAGATIYYHGDFDGEGLRIAASVVARIGAVPWHLSADDYAQAADSHAPPVGRVTPVPWDEELGAELERRGVSVPEERVADALLDTLAEQIVGRLP